MKLEDAQDILFNGTREQISQLPGGVSYVYTPEHDSFRIKVGANFVHGYGAGEPNCVKYFGNKHSF